MPRNALFVDRDGTLITDVGYPRDPSRVELLPGVVPVLLEVIARGWALVIIGNQSGVGRGMITADEATRVEARVEALFAEHGVRFDGAYFCFHGPAETCRCRKPEPGMLLDAARDLSLDLDGSVMIGDKASDVQAGKAAGCRTIAFGAVVVAGADAQCPTWESVATWLTGRSGAPQTPR